MTKENLVANKNLAINIGWSSSLFALILLISAIITEFDKINKDSFQEIINDLSIVSCATFAIGPLVIVLHLILFLYLKKK